MNSRNRMFWNSSTIAPVPGLTQQDREQYTIRRLLEQANSRFASERTRQRARRKLDELGIDY